MKNRSGIDFLYEKDGSWVAGFTVVQVCACSGKRQSNKVRGDKILMSVVRALQATPIFSRTSLAKIMLYVGPKIFYF